MPITLSAIKADVGSIGGHTRPSDKMLSAVKAHVHDSISRGLIIDGFVTSIGDDINLLLSHERGENNPDIHLDTALRAFQEAARLARQDGLYGAGQDLLIDAPSGNIRGAGPGVAEVTFSPPAADPSSVRPAESFLLFAADKCGPGAYNLPLYLAFADPMYCAGLLLSPKMQAGFTFTIIDMNQAKFDSIIRLNAPEDSYKIAALLRDNERFAIDAIHSRAYPDQQAAAVSAQRLHNIAGTYTGKDDPVALVRTQGIFPAPEEVVHPWTIGHYVGGDARGSHNMPILPVPAQTPVTGTFAQPLVTALGFSLAEDGAFASQFVDFFANLAWSHVQNKIQAKGIEIRRQGWSGPAMMPYSELEYGGIKTIIEHLQTKFHPRQPTANP